MMMMRLTGQAPPDAEAQELVWDAMEVIHTDNQKAAQLCRKALEIYSDCTDALTMLAELETNTVCDFVRRLRKAVEAGRRDLGPRCFKEGKGAFWGLTETRPFMRALAMLSDGLIEWGTPEAVDEAIEIHEEMLELNPNDNQGVRDWLAGCYLVRERYDDAATLFAQYPDDWLSAPAWARVLHAYVTDSAERASELLVEARERNPHVEQYLTGRKRRPRGRAGMYSPGDETEAVYCVAILWEAWKKHPKVKKWLKEVTGPSQSVNSELANKSASRHTPETAGNPDPDLRELLADVPEAFVVRFLELVQLVDGFCDAHLNHEYKELSREMALSICQPGTSVLKGKPESWAAGIVSALGAVNFLTDPSQTPHLKSKQIAEGFGISVGTMHAKAKVFREELGLMPLHPGWTLPSRMDDNPLAWMIEVNGFIVDIRMAPREMQVAAYDEGLIPYIPADRDE